MQPIMNAAQQKQKDTDFDRQLQAARVSVLAQAGRSETVKKSFTASAAALVAAAMFAVSMAPQQAHAGDITFERIAKDALGGAAGAALFGQFGKGRGRDAMRVIGAVAGVAVAESMQQPKPQTYTFSMSPGQGFSMQQNGGQNMVSGPALVGGTEILSQDKREKLAAQERSALAARDVYARALHTLQQAEENQVLSPRSKSAQQETSAANSAAQSALQQYATARADFMNACEFMAKRGYDMQEFAYNYSLMQRTVTAKDMHPRDMAEIDVQRRQYAAPAY